MTGNDWQCHFDNSYDSFAIEVLRGSDADSQKRLHNEFNVFLTLEEVYQSGQLLRRDRITPRRYGALEVDGMYVLSILELWLCDGVLRVWKELNNSER